MSDTSFNMPNPGLSTIIYALVHSVLLPQLIDITILTIKQFISQIYLLKFNYKIIKFLQILSWAVHPYSKKNTEMY